MSLTAIEGIIGAAGKPAFNPISLAPDFWLRADDVTGHVTGDALASAPDSSGHGLTASQATTAKRPTWITNVINGHSVFRFVRASSQHFLVPTFFPGNSSSSIMTMFVVAKGADTTAGSLVSLRRVSTGWQHRVNSAGPNEFMGANLAATPGSVRDNIGLSTTAWNVFEVMRTGLTIVVGHNGTLVGNIFSTYVPQTLTPLQIGGEDAAGSGFSTATFYSGDIAEVIAWNRVLTLGERDSFTKAYAAPRYSITVT